MIRVPQLMYALALVAGTAAAQQNPAVSGRPTAGDTLRLTRRQAIATSLLANPQIEVARQQTQQVRAQRVLGMAIPDPVLSAGYDSISGPLRFNSAGSQGASVGLTVPFPDKVRLQNRIGVSNIRASEAEFRLVQQQIAAQAGGAYDAVLVTRLHRRDLTEARALAADFLKRTQARFDAGAVPRLDVIKAQVDLAQADNDLIVSARDVTNADAALNRVLGRALGLPIEPADSLAPSEPLPDLDLVEATALRSRPELASLDAQRRANLDGRTLLREQAVLPDLSFGASRDLMLPSGGTWYFAGLEMPIPVFFWQHTRGDFAENTARQRELDATYRDAVAAVGQDVRSTYAGAAAAQLQVTFLRDQMLPSAREAYRVSSVSYGLGGVSALEVLDARRTLLDAQRQYADALAAANSARSDLERAAGVPLSTLATGAPRE